MTRARIRRQGKRVASPMWTRDTLARRLERCIADAEATLKQLERDPKAWKVLDPIGLESGQVVAFGNLARAAPLLGDIHPPREAAILPTREIRALAAIRNRVQECLRCRRRVIQPQASGDSIDASTAILLAQEHHPRLFARYEKERKSPCSPGLFEDAPAWRAAEAAAVANAALNALDNPVVVEAAERFLWRLNAVENLHEERRQTVDAAGGQAVDLARPGIEQAAVKKEIVKLRRHAKKRAEKKIEGDLASGKLPEMEKLAVRRARSRIAKEQQAEYVQAVAPLHDAIRAEFARLRDDGLRPHSAARAIWKNGETRRRLIDLAGTLPLDRPPWRGQFYSFSAIRQIVGA